MSNRRFKCRFWRCRYPALTQRSSKWFSSSRHKPAFHRPRVATFWPNFWRDLLCLQPALSQRTFLQMFRWRRRFERLSRNQVWKKYGACTPTAMATAKCEKFLETELMGLGGTFSWSMCHAIIPLSCIGYRCEKMIGRVHLSRSALVQGWLCVPFCNKV